MQGLDGFRTVGEVVDRVIDRLRRQRLLSALAAVRWARVHALDSARWTWHPNGTRALEAAADECHDAENALLDLLAAAR
ncbi:MAG: hypothetical protein ACHQF3_00055 [Alphaproteobacteria bacterium]